MSEAGLVEEVFETGVMEAGGAAMESGMAGIEMSEAAEVADNAAVQEVAELPAPAAEVAENPGMLSRVKSFLNDNPYGQRLVRFAKWAAPNAASAVVVTAIMYGMNQALAKKSHETGKRTALSEYLKGVEAKFTELGLTWNQEIKQKTAEDALAFPWIDATQ